MDTIPAQSSRHRSSLNRRITEYLNILNLNGPDYTILNWIAVLVEHRRFSIKTPIARRAKQYLIDNFSVNVNAYDKVQTLQSQRICSNVELEPE